MRASTSVSKLLSAVSGSVSIFLTSSVYILDFGQTISNIICFVQLAHLFRKHPIGPLHSRHTPKTAPCFNFVKFPVPVLCRYCFFHSNTLFLYTLENAQPTYSSLEIRLPPTTHRSTYPLPQFFYLFPTPTYPLANPSPPFRQGMTSKISQSYTAQSQNTI